MTTLLTHIFNEEYLLPFWLNHHKKIFDKIIIVDYRSTDRSIEICKSICPDCTVITSRNLEFDAHNVDIEMMELEDSIEGIKMILNTTEFLFSEIPLKELFTEKASYSVNAFGAYSKKNYEVNNIKELFGNLLNDDIVFHHDRFVRFIHNYSNGSYIVGRHITNNPTTITNKMHIIWFGYYPMNRNLLNRKLQIKQHMSQRDITWNLGRQHLNTENEMLAINTEKANTGISLYNINRNLYNIISTVNAYVYHPDLLSNNWGADYVMLNNDINLLNNDEGYKILDINDYGNLLQRYITNEIGFITNKYIYLENYHNEITEEEHIKILNSMPYKKNKCSDMNDFCVYLETYISSIVNEPVKIFNDDIWVRICRPSSISDFNPCHKDVYLDFYRNTVNIYLPIVGSNEKSSLKIHPGSHKWSESNTIVTKGGAVIKGKKYSVDTIVASKIPLNMIRPNPTQNQLLLFSPYLIHGCSDNGNENMTRMSLEIRFIRNDRNRVIEQESKYNDFVKNRNWR